MPATEPIQGGPYPEPSDTPDGPNQMAAITAWAAGRLVMRFASTITRDAAITSPVEGMVATTGTGATLVKWLYVSGAWVALNDFLTGVWTAYTPTFVNLTLGNGTVAARFRKALGWADVEVDVTRGSTTTFAAPPYIGLPADALPHGDLTTLAPLGSLTYRQGVAHYLGVVTRTGFNGRTHLDGGLTPSNTVPFTGASGDVLSLRLRYPHA